MKLNPGERSVLAYFRSGHDVRLAAEELHRHGFKTVQTDRVSRYGTNADAHINNPVNNALTNTGPTLFSAGNSGSLSAAERILLSADPSVGGYGNPDSGAAGGKAFLLTLVTNEAKIKQAEDIIRKHGGFF